MQKLFIKQKKRRKKEKIIEEKNGQVYEIFKTMGTQMPTMKKREER
jgi:predicted GIY-YIG superfamily endonuclease